MKTSKKKQIKRETSEMLPEYDFSKGIRGKYAKRYAAGTNVVLLAPDVAKRFPDSQSVNRALRAFAKIRRRAMKHQSG
jgi:hypothetical protein